MSEDSNKPPSINLEELERQLREALSRRSSSSDPANSAGNNEDPLSMLARLVEYEGASKQAQAQPAPPVSAPSYAPSEPAQSVQAPSYPDPAYQPPAGWQPFVEQTPVEPLATYQAHDHLVFDPNQHAALNDPRVPRAVEPPSAPPVYAPYVPQTAPSSPYETQSEPVEPQARAESAPYYSGASAVSGVEAQFAPHPVSTQPEAYTGQAPEAPRDYFTQSQPVSPSAPDQTVYEPKAYQPHRTETATHDILALSPSEIRPSSDLAALNGLYSQSRPGHEPVAEHSSAYASPQMAPQTPEQRSAADRALVYAAAFPEQPSQSSQCASEQTQGVGLSYSEAEANLGAEQRPVEPPKKGQGKGMMILLGLIVVMAGGFGLAAYLRNEGARVPSGAPPVISADKNPVKVVPANPGGTEVPNQGAAIYQPSKPEDAKDAKVISTDEKPVDISAAPRPPGSPLIGEPKKIRTVTVRPDGTLVEENIVAAGSPVPNSAAVPRAAPSMVTVMPPPAAPPVAVPPPATAQPANPPAAQVTAGASAVRVMPPMRPQAAEPVSTPPVAAPTARATAPTPSATPAATPAPAPAPAPATADTADRAPTGDYGVQFSAPATEAEARNAIVALKRSYASILDGVPIASQKAENNGRTIFRVRAVGLNREEAISICEKIKSSGGQCFVARN